MIALPKLKQHEWPQRLELRHPPSGKVEDKVIQDAIEELKVSHPGCEVKLVKLTPAEEAAQRLDGTFDPGKVLVDVRLNLPRAVDFITLDVVIDPTVKKEAPGQDGDRAPIQHHVSGEVDEGR